MTAFDKYLSDAYEIVDVLKSTEKSFVALVYDKNAKRLCVMKERNLQSLSLYKILRELDSPNVPKIFRLFECDGKLIVVEEHIDGQTLNELLNYQPEILTEQFVGDIFLQICDALIPLHKADVIHRDLTPSNIMLTKGNVVKLIDFGIARIFKPDNSADTEFLGTRGYAAPEQLGVFELGQTDARTDIFILGTTIKNLLGKDYDGRLAKVLNRCMDLNPAMRYQSVSDLIHAIKRARRLWLLKRFGLIGATACTIFFATQFIGVDVPANDLPHEKISAPVVNDEPLPQNDDGKKSESPPPALNSKITDSLVEFINNPQFDADKVELPAINVEPLPQITRPQSESKFAKHVELSLYINGKLSESNWRTTLGTFNLDDGYKHWRRDDNGNFLFPANWKVRLHIENFTAKDLFTPKVEVEFAREEISFDIPTVPAGQTRDVDIPVAGHVALEFFDAEHIQGKIFITISSPSEEHLIILQRRFEISK